MLAVNVSRSARRAGFTIDESNPPDWVVGEWALAPETARAQVGQPLVAIAGNTVVARLRIKGFTESDGRITFATDELEDSSRDLLPNIGEDAPQWAQWVRGQANPVRIGPRLPMPDNGGNPLQAHLGDASLTWTPASRRLTVQVPAGTEVHIHTV